MSRPCQKRRAPSSTPRAVHEALRPARWGRRSARRGASTSMPSPRSRGASSLGDLVHAPQAREEAERAAAEAARELLEHVGRLAHEVAAAAQRDHAHVGRVGERARHRERARSRSPRAPRARGRRARRRRRRPRTGSPRRRRRSAGGRAARAGSRRAGDTGRTTSRQRSKGGTTSSKRDHGVGPGALEGEREAARRLAQIGERARRARACARLLGRHARQHVARCARRAARAKLARGGEGGSPARRAPARRRSRRASGSSARPSAAKSCCSSRRQARASVSSAAARAGCEQRLAARPARRRRPPEELVEALEHLVGPHLERVDLVGDVGAARAPRRRSRARRPGSRAASAAAGRGSRRRGAPRASAARRRPSGHVRSVAHCSRVHCSARAATERRSRSRSGRVAAQQRRRARVPISPCARVRAHASSTAYATRSSGKRLRLAPLGEHAVEPALRRRSWRGP